MASLVRLAKGWRMFFDGPDGRKAIWLGSKTRKGREDRTRVLNEDQDDGKAPREIRQAFDWIEELVACRRVATSPSPRLAAWLRDIDDRLHDRIAAAGLCEPRVRTTIGELLDRFEASCEVKPSTLLAYRQAFESLRETLGADRCILAVTKADADAWRQGLADEGLAKATQAKRTRVAKSVFRQAVKWGLLAASPFEDLRCGSQTNPDRLVYVPRPVVEQVLAVCSDDRWRGIVALARFAGLRCPSELVGLTWADVNFERHRLTVRSPKTAHHEGRGSRIVPLLPIVEEILLRLYAAAPEGEPKVFPRLRTTATNLRTQLLRILDRASVQPWPRLLQNLRASAATDFVEKRGAHVASAWCGHTAAVAARHYLSVRDEDFEAVTGPELGKPSPSPAAKGVRQGAQKALKSDRTPSTAIEQDRSGGPTQAEQGQAVACGLLLSCAIGDWAGWDSNPRHGDYESPALDR